MIDLRLALPRAADSGFGWVRSIGAELRTGTTRSPTGDGSPSLHAGLPAAALLTALLGVALATTLDLSNPGQLPTAWLVALLVAVTARLLQAVYWRQVPPTPDSSAPLWGCLAGLLLTSLAWAALPWITFARLDFGGRTVVMLATLGAACIEARPMRVLPRLATLQLAWTLAPGIGWLVLFGDAADLSVGAMAAMLSIVIVAGLRASHASFERLLAAQADGDRLSLIEIEQALQIEHLRRDATEARGQMAQAQLGLEQRIDERTATLEGRSLELARQAVTDSLTGLPNRKGINDHLTELLAPLSNAEGDDGSELALLFLDLDDFKDVNDQFGHLAGDAVLCQVAERLRESLPRAGFAARWGGDEFIVVLPGLGRRVEQLRILAEQVRAELCQPMRIDKGVVRIGCSIGIAIAPHHGRTPEALVISADHAVYAAKSDRQDRVRVFDVELAKRAGRQHHIAQGLPAALELGQLQVAYQPIVSADDGSATHVEALTRWLHPKWGAVSPAEFIPVAEATGHIHTLGRWVLRQACLDAARWPGTRPPKVSVNVSAMQVTSGRLVAQVREALAAAKLPAQRLMIELTESLPMAGRNGVDATLAELRQMGVTLAIDDFGTGYSSLSALLKQPLSLIKVDRSFVQDVPGEGELLIKATVDVARCFGLAVVAEGVETAAQRTRLVALGVSYMQGYLFGRPMPHAEFIAWLGLRDGSEAPFALQA